MNGGALMILGSILIFERSATFQYSEESGTTTQTSYEKPLFTMVTAMGGIAWTCGTTSVICHCCHSTRRLHFLEHGISENLRAVFRYVTILVNGTRSAEPRDVLASPEFKKYRIGQREVSAVLAVRIMEVISNLPIEHSIS
jgi:hypothetical protein